MVISPKTMIIPVLVAVSQATLDAGSSAKQASRMASETWSLYTGLIRSRTRRIESSLPNLVRVTFADRLGGEEKSARGLLRSCTVGAVDHTSHCGRKERRDRGSMGIGRGGRRYKEEVKVEESKATSIDDG